MRMTELNKYKMSNNKNSSGGRRLAGITKDMLLVVVASLILIITTGRRGWLVANVLHAKPGLIMFLFACSPSDSSSAPPGRGNGII